MTQTPRYAEWMKTKWNHTCSKIPSLPHKSQGKMSGKCPAQPKIKLPEASGQTKANLEPPKERWTGAFPGGGIPTPTWPLTSGPIPRAWKATEDTSLIWIDQWGQQQREDRPFNLFIVKSKMGGCGGGGGGWGEAVKLKQVLKDASTSDAFAFCRRSQPPGERTPCLLLQRFLESHSPAPLLPAECRKAASAPNMP